MKMSQVYRRRVRVVTATRAMMESDMSSASSSLSGEAEVRRRVREMRRRAEEVARAKTTRMDDEDNNNAETRQRIMTTTEAHDAAEDKVRMSETALIEAYAKAMEEIEALKSMVETLRSKVEDEARASANATRELDEAKEAARRAEEDAIAIRERVEATMAERDEAAKQEVDRMRDEIERLSARLSEEGEEKSKLDDARRSAEASLVDMEKALKEEMDRMRDEMERLSARLSEEGEEKSKSDDARLSAEASLIEAEKALEASVRDREEIQKRLEEITEQAHRFEKDLTAARHEVDVANEALRRKMDAVPVEDVDALRKELDDATKGRQAASEDVERLSQMVQTVKRDLEIAATENANLEEELIAVRSAKSNSGDIELFEQLVESQQLELSTLRELNEESGAEIKKLQSEIEALTIERDAILESANRRGDVADDEDDERATSTSERQDGDLTLSEDFIREHEAKTRDRVMKQLMNALKAEAVGFVEAQESKSTKSTFDARKSIDGVYYFIGDVRPNAKARVIYNRETNPQMSRDGQVFIHAGFNGWSLGSSVKVGMSPLAHDAKERDVDHRVRDSGNWWVAEFDVADGASTINFVFSDTVGHFDNCNHKDYHCPVESQATSRDERIQARLNSQLEKKGESIKRSAARAGARAGNYIRTRQAHMVKSAEAAKLGRVYTIPHEPVAGDKVTIVYRPEGGPLAHSDRVFCEGSWNRRKHSAKYGPTAMSVGDSPGTMTLTLNVPKDAHVMDFKFTDEDALPGSGKSDDNGDKWYHVSVAGGSGSPPSLKVVHIAVEMAPIAKVGGMGDVVTALARATQEDGHTVEVIVPHYDCMLFDAVDGYHRVGGFVHQNVEVEVYKGWVEDVPTTLLRPKNGHFDVGCIYGRHDDHVRFGFFTDAALTWMRSIHQEVDIIHAHDWQTAPATWGNYYNAATALTLHNLQFGVDLISRGMASCDIATTVSPTYADEVRSHHAVAPSHEKFIGIRNGIDTDIWNPSADEFLPQAYDASTADDGKRAAAMELCIRLGIDYREDAPIVGVVSRLTAQKGIHLIKHACYRALERGATFVLLGSAPDPAHQHEFNALAQEMSKKYPGRSGFMFKYDEPLSHLIYAGCDFLLVPSMFEPCGLTQMIAMRYGTVPVVRRTGGLRDTVFDVENDGARSVVAGVPPNGFVFDGTETPDIDYALNRALDAYYDRPRWRSLDLVRVAMTCDWSWFVPSRAYTEEYWRALHHKRA